MFDISFSFLVMIIMFGVLIAGTAKAFWDLVNDDTSEKEVKANPGFRMHVGPSLQGIATTQPKSIAV